MCTGTINLPDGLGSDLTIDGTLELSDGEIKGSGTMIIKGTLYWTQDTLSVSSVTSLPGGTANASTNGI